MIKHEGYLMWRVREMSELVWYVRHMDEDSSIKKCQSLMVKRTCGRNRLREKWDKVAKHDFCMLGLMEVMTSARDLCTGDT